MSVDDNIMALRMYFVKKFKEHEDWAFENGQVIVTGYVKNDPNPVILQFMSWKFAVVRRYDSSKYLDDVAVVYFCGDEYKTYLCHPAQIGNLVTTQALRREWIDELELEKLLKRSPDDCFGAKD